MKIKWISLFMLRVYLKKWIISIKVMTLKNFFVLKLINKNYENNLMTKIFVSLNVSQLLIDNLSISHNRNKNLNSFKKYLCFILFF